MKGSEMAQKERITKVWIEEGCIVCDACETAAPTVFEVTDDTCIIRPEALNPDFTKPLTAEIVEAAEECPTDVIKYDVVLEDAPEGADAPTPPAAKSTASADAAGEAPAKAAPAKSPEAPAPKPAEPVTAAATAAKAPGKSDEAADGLDPGIQALLKAATQRGGNVGILKKAATVPESVQSIKRKPARDLPPDAKQARVIQEAKKRRKDPDKDRRALLNTAALTVGWSAFGVSVGVSCGPAFARFMMPNVLEEPDPRVRVGKIGKYVEMEPGDVNEDYKPQGIWMIREESRIAALSIICTHLGCIPNWLKNDRKFKCPCHGSGYRPDGINFEGPTPRPLERFKIFVEDGIVIVDKSNKYQYELGQWDMLGSYLEV